MSLHVHQSHKAKHKAKHLTLKHKAKAKHLTLKHKAKAKYQISVLKHRPRPSTKPSTNIPACQVITWLPGNYGSKKDMPGNCQVPGNAR